MEKRDREILNQFAMHTRAKYPDAKIWAFGSRTRGKAVEDSDLDVCVVLRQVDGEIRKSISRLAWEVGFENDVLISTVVFSNYLFQQGPCSVSSLVRTIQADGIPA